LQGKAVEQYRRALDAANVKLTAAVRKNDELKSSLDGAKAKYTDLKSRIDQARAAYQASVKATGDNSEASNLLGLELLELENSTRPPVRRSGSWKGSWAPAGNPCRTPPTR
jgi:uncharacterized coiled-coil DUF342 family protein